MAAGNHEPELVVDARAELGEGPVWDDRKQQLYWVDITGQAIHVFDPVDRTDRRIEVASMVSAVIPRRSRGLIATLHGALAWVDEQTGFVDLFKGDEIPTIDERTNRFNDAKCDPSGRLWAGTMSLEKERQPTGELFVIDSDHAVSRKLTGIRVSNGMAWSRNGRELYYIDTSLQRVDVFAFNPDTAEIYNRRTAFTVPAELGHPDGMTIDTRGMLWIALWGGSAVSRWNPGTGDLLQLIRFPVSQVTSCTFGGPHLNELYVTTAREGLSPGEQARQPLAGGLFRVTVNARGRPASYYAG